MNSQNLSMDRNNLIYVIFGLLLAVPPLFQGLFPVQNWLLYEALVFVYVTIVLFTQRHRGLSINANTFSILALPILYLLSFTFAVDKGGNILETLKMAGYAAICYTSLYMAIMEKEQYLFKFVFWGAIASAIISIGSVFGTFNYPGAFLNGRLYSVLQYPNTFAAFVLAVLMIGISFFLMESKTSNRILILAGNSALMVSFFATLSRGGLIVLLIGGVVLTLGIQAKYRIKLLIYLIYLSGIGFVFANQIITEKAHQSALLGWGWFLLAIVFGLVPELWTKFSATNKDSKKKISKVWVLVVLILSILVLSAVTIYFDEQNYTNILNRFSDSRNVQERIVFYLDALRIAKDYPLIGVGGNGWDSLYRQYQPYNYSTKTVHSFPLQIFVETGILGIMALLAILFITFVKSLRVLKSLEGKQYTFFLAITCAALILGLHSVIDVDMSIPSVAILFWSIIGAIWGVDNKISRFMSLKENDSKNRLIDIPRVTLVLTVISVLFITITLSFFISGVYTKKGAHAYNKGNYTEATRLFKLAMFLNPAESNNYAHLSKIYMISGVDNNSQDDLKHSLKYINKALWLKPNDPEYRVLKGKTLLDLDLISEGVKEFEKAHQLTPYVQNFAEQLEEIYILVGRYYIMKKDLKMAYVYFEKASKFPSQINKRILEMTVKYRKLQVNKDSLKFSQVLKDRQLEANQLVVFLSKKGVGK